MNALKSVLLLLFLLAASPAPVLPAFPQERPKRPVLIRDTDKAEGKDEAPESKEKTYNPMMAEKSVTVGNFYMKKKNYAAAVQRYLEALEYQPNRWEAFEALTKAYEKNGEKDKALEVCKDFIRKFPDSPKAPEFRAKISKLERKS